MVIPIYDRELFMYNLKPHVQDFESEFGRIFSTCFVVTHMLQENPLEKVTYPKIWKSED